MRFKLDIDVSPHPWLKRAAAVVLVPVSIVALAGVVSADPPAKFHDGDTLTAARLNDAISSIDARLARAEALVPAGTVIAYSGAATPAGWLPCDGVELDSSKHEYRALYKAIGVSFGGSATSGMFNLPDLRGRFLRGVDQQSGHDPEAAARSASNPGGNDGDNVGSVQASAVGPHTHSNHATGLDYNVLVDFGNGEYASSVEWVTAESAINAGAGSASETRPVNVSVNWIIKL